jgi:hypothetical protein
MGKIIANASVIVSGEVKARGNKRFFSNQEEEDIVSYYENGMSLPKIKDVYGCSHWTTIYNVLKRHGVTRRRRGNIIREINPAEKELISQLWNDGKSVLAISKEVDMSYEKLRSWMIKQGFKR